LITGQVQGGLSVPKSLREPFPTVIHCLTDQIGTHASPQFLFKKLAYDPIKDFAPIGQLTTSGIALVVNQQVPSRDLKEFVAFAQSRQGGLQLRLCRWRNQQPVVGRVV